MLGPNNQEIDFHFDHDCHYSKGLNKRRGLRNLSIPKPTDLSIPQPLQQVWRGLRIIESPVA